MDNCILICLPYHYIPVFILPYQANRKVHFFFTSLGYFFFLQNPQFENFTTYVIFAHLLRQIAALTDQDHHFLVHWMKGYAKIVYNYKSFVRTHLFHAFGFNQTS